MEPLKYSFHEVQHWMSANMLKLNSDKTKMIIFAPKQYQNHFLKTELYLDSTTRIISKTTVKNLGVIFDSSMSMKHQINSVTKSCYQQIRRIKKIRKYLTEDAAKSLVNAHVTSRLDYCNSLFAGLPRYLIQKLQRVQNCAVRLIKRVPYRQSITRHTKSLHWLPVTERINFKILLIVYKSLNNVAPQYLKTMFQYYRPIRTLRSSSKSLLTVKRHRTSYGARAISKYGPVLWNQLPLAIRNADTVPQFKSLLKTHLFEKSYNTN